jgi:exodeoxyribonuclease V beta subunit
MTAFNVLDRKESVTRHLFLEASAGTGKTFAIENIVVRLILDQTLIENILVVTFTKMAAGELKERIHSNLEKCLHLLKQVLLGEDVKNMLPDYLLERLEQGIDAIRQAKKRIEHALFSFDLAQIFTIHAFCWRMLKNYSIEAEISLDAGSYEDRSASKTQLLQVVRDFLKYGINASEYSRQQLKRITEKVKSSEKLQKELLHEISRGVEIEAGPPFFETFQAFQAVMKRLKNKYEGSKILKDCLSLASSYKGLCDIKGKIHQENEEKFTHFAALFDKTEWIANDLDSLIEKGIFPLEAFDPNNSKVKIKDVFLHYPNLLSDLQESLEPLIFQASNEQSIFSRLARDCQLFMRRYQEREEIFNHADLLVQMRKAIEKPSFLKCVRQNFSAVIVDEFQDTDPVQWEIFSFLFASPNEWNGYLHLVGDPKQSIYAFRQADIYTYLRAAEKLGSKSMMTLNTNYRSQPSLIAALNALFHSAFDPFTLPKLSQSLPYRNVHAGRKSGTVKEIPLQFWEVRNENSRKRSLDHLENDLILPAIGQEILRLHEAEGLKFDQFAILVSDRYQEKRVFNYLRTLDIPVKSQRGADLSASSAVHEMRDLLNGVINCHSKSHLSIALAGRLIGMTHAGIALLADENRLFKIVETFMRLQNTLDQFGFAAFYREFMETSWHVESVMEHLLKESDGPKFYREWQDLADLMIAEEHARHLLPHGLIDFLDELDELSLNDDERVGIYVDFQEEGVTILTTHLSKGLEFDVVFALGLITRPPSSEGKLILFDSVLGAVKGQEDPRYLKFCEELDAEKMRQLYVALTRAREKLYVPVVIEENAKEIPNGCASPLELFLTKLEKPLSQLAAEFPETIGLSKLNRLEEIDPARNQEKPPLLIPPAQVDVPGLASAVQSFTSLAQGKNSHSFEEELVIPHDFFRMEKTEYSLPSGSETGVLLHKIFELLPFESVRDLQSHHELIPSIAPFLNGTPFDAWEEVIARIIFNTLKAPFLSGFCLADIDSKKLYRETEFLYPCDLNHPMLQGVQANEGFLKGVVDLFFEHQGKFYLLDWKTNWLGHSQEYYQRQHLEEAMAASDYLLQAKIYCEAFKRYLQLFNLGPFHACFGGIYYLFVRGIGPNTGILHVSNEELGF